MDAEVFMSINPLRKKSRSVKFALFGKALIEFILAKQDVIWLSDHLILEKALRLREQLKINASELQLSNGWLSELKEWNSIRSRTLRGESGSVCETVLKASQTQIQSLTAKFSPEDVFNLDETALYYRLPPKRTLPPFK
uniref:AlNc14C532G12074 protein n=1 Tax=Albugo laibachii Nc14 TaxID=890382 RepID=F0X0Y4_9STRA|nr:AlNc14C532G12074 [Albugo laibachii Nc14]|eukprot:CCA27430.1 AlNc14C532G12074 [Albugo laibachii Nc14]